MANNRKVRASNPRGAICLELAVMKFDLEELMELKWKTEIWHKYDHTYRILDHLHHQIMWVRVFVLLSRSEKMIGTLRRTAWIDFIIKGAPFRRQCARVRARAQHLPCRV